VAAFTADGASAISAGVATLTITGIGSTVAETFVAAVTSVADAVASFTAAMAVTSTAVTHSAAAVATSMAEETSTVDTVAADPMAAVMADTGKFLNSSTPQTAGSTLCWPFSFWFGPGAKPAMRNAFVVAT
jgi:hypothetical protein